MGRKTETNEQKVLKVYPNMTISDDFEDKDYAWGIVLKKINAAKRKKYYKRKITRPNNEKKVKVTIMLYPSHQKAAIEQYGSVQKFINTIVEQLKLSNNENSKV